VEIGDAENITYKDAKTALRRGLLYFKALQAEDGHWPAENSGCLFFEAPFVSYSSLSLLILYYSFVFYSLNIYVKCNDMVLLGHMLVHHWTFGENLDFGTSQRTIALHVQPSGELIM